MAYQKVSQLAIGKWLFRAIVGDWMANQREFRTQSLLGCLLAYLLTGWLIDWFKQLGLLTLSTAFIWRENVSVQKKCENDARKSSLMTNDSHKSILPLLGNMPTIVK